MRNKIWPVLLIGDILVLGGVTLTGFATHGETGAVWGRMLATFIPLVASWLLVGVVAGVYNVRRVVEWKQLWRPFYAMVVAGPFAGWMRGMLLGNAPIIPIFVMVLGGISALALLAWRALAWLLWLRKRTPDG
jgi:hypothetical protein